MKEKIIVMTIAAAFLMSPVSRANEGRGGLRSDLKEKKQAFKEEQNAQKKELFENLDGKTAEERKQALENFKKAKAQSRKDLQAQLHEQEMNTLRDTFAKDSTLPAERKKQLLEQHERQYQATLKFQEEQKKKLEIEIEKIRNNNKLPEKQKKELVKKFRQEQKRMYREHIKQMRKEGVKS